jgi:LPS O-antigen subunit length determinant protein (WzzB/FepE family)
LKRKQRLQAEINQFLQEHDRVLLGFTERQLDSSRPDAYDSWDATVRRLQEEMPFKQYLAIAEVVQSSEPLPEISTGALFTMRKGDSMLKLDVLNQQIIGLRILELVGWT